ncbi:MAG: NAD(P)H-hydrate dehydratase [Candidatus Neomarinimicrobiota bacterium]
MKLLTIAQAKRLDGIGLKKHITTGQSLMKNAGRCVSDFAISLLQKEKNPEILVICGKGNNGGDGFAAASILKDNNYNVNIHTLVSEKEISGEGLKYFLECKKKGVLISFSLEIQNSSFPDLIIDGLFGTGLSRAISPKIFKYIQWVNQSNSKVLAIDIPSGLNGDTGEVCSIAVKADKTITFGYPKLGMILKKGPEYCGQIIEKDIGFPEISDTILGGISWTKFSEEKCKEFLKKPELDNHKYTSGKVLIIAGSKGMTGAAILSTSAALRSGAGLTITTTPSSLNYIYETNLIEGITFSLPDEDRGYLDISHYDSIMEKVEWADSVLIGPGLGRSKSTQLLIKKLVKFIDKPLILDADGLFPFSDSLNKLSSKKTPLIITPHFGEFSRLINISVEDIISNFPTIMEDTLKVFNHTLLVKQVPMCIMKNNKAVLNITGNPGLATAGTGDILSGILASFLSSGLNSFDAATVGSFVQGKSSDKLLSSKGYRGQIASDLLDIIPSVISKYELS